MTTKSLKEKTANGLFWGSINSGAQQVLNLVFGIFLGRLLSPADYGMVGMLTIFTLIATSLQESGFISGLNRKKNVTAADYNAVFWFNVLCSVSIYVILFFSAPLIAAWYRQPILVPLARLSFLSFVISALNTSPRAWLFRNMRVRETALITMIALTASGIIGVCLAWQGFAYWGIAIQNLVFCLILTIGSWWFAEWHPTLHIDLRPLRGMIGFSSKLLATNIFTHINNNIFSIFFGRFYGEKTVGYYNQANKWTGMGYTMLTGMMCVKPTDFTGELLFVSRGGLVKRVELAEYNINRARFAATGLKDGDLLLTVKRLSGESNLLMITEQGMAIHFKTAEVSLIGRTAAGVKGLTLAPEDRVAFVLPDDEEGEVLLVSDKGFMKRCLLIDFDLQARAGKGVKCFAFQKNGANGTRICAALLVKQPFDFVAKQKSGQETPLNTNTVRIERRDSRGSMYAMCVLDDTIEFVERTIQRGN